MNFALRNIATKVQLPCKSPRRKKRDIGVHKNTHRVVRCRSSAKSPSSIIDMLLNRKSLPGKTTEIKIVMLNGAEVIVIDETDVSRRR